MAKSLLTLFDKGSFVVRKPTCLLLISLCCGCDTGPKRIKAPKIDPVAAAKKAMGDYDLDGDDRLSGEEIAASPGLQASISNYDKDDDGVISKDEIRERIESLTRFKSALMPLAAVVRYKNKPLAGANIKFVPEDFLGDQVKSAMGVTNQSGEAGLSIAQEHLPADRPDLRGVHYGTYRVEITHPEKNIPEKYNTATTIGYETQRGNRLAEFDLQ